MRIELPSVSWDATVQRAEDDAHTLTLGAQPANDWLPGDVMADPAGTVRTGIAPAEPTPLTITF
jgi:hypothetical protein